MSSPAMTASQTDAVAETTPFTLMGEAMARYKHDEIAASEAVKIILEQANRLSAPLPELSGNPGRLSEAAEIVEEWLSMVGTFSPRSLSRVRHVPVCQSEVEAIHEILAALREEG